MPSTDLKPRPKRSDPGFPLCAQVAVQQGAHPFLGERLALVRAVQVILGNYGLDPAGGARQLSAPFWTSS